MWQFSQFDSKISAKIAIFLGLTVPIILATRKVYAEYFGKTAELTDRRKRRQKERIENLAAFEEKLKLADGQLINRNRQAILSLSTEELLLSIRENKYTPLEVLKAFQAKALEANKACNCIVLLIEEAETWCGKLMENEENRDLPLYGLPVSIKDDFDVAGYDTTLGFSKFLYDIKEEDAVIVKTLKKLGAVPFCRTNAPQSLMTYNCSNPIYGVTTNPYDPKRTPGGSSGGESALIGSGGSPLGIGSDVGGSVRIPAVMCGIASLKPTGRRVSTAGETFGVPGCQGMINTPGIMARDVETVAIAAKEIFGSGHMHDNDPMCVPLPWRDHMETSQKPLRIGFYESSNVFPVFPGMRRAVREAARALQKAGHEVIPFHCCDSSDVMADMTKLYFGDGGRLLNERWKNDKVDKGVSNLYSLTTKPNWYKRLFLEPFHRQSAPRTWLVGVTSSDELWKLMVIREERIRHYISEWKEKKLDLVLAPGFAFPAIPWPLPDSLFGAVIYTCLYNYLDFPAGIVPVTKENEDDQMRLIDYNVYGDQSLKLAKEAVKDATGLPLGVQIVGLPWQEETVVRGMKALNNALKTQ